MCDTHTMDDALEYTVGADRWSRRQFGSLGLGAGLATLLPSTARAAAVTALDVNIATPDGVADAFFVFPAEGRHPAVLIWPDIFGLRHAFRQMGTRLAESGYAVLVVNPFYRTQRAPTAPEKPDFQDPDTRAALMKLAGTLSATTAVTDARAFVGWLDKQSAVDTQRRIATTGYCMGGPLTMRTAAAIPDRVGAGASFHGGNLVTDKPESPHLLVPQMKAQYLIAIAVNDDERQPEAKVVLRDAFAAASLPAEIEVYPGAMHGWCPPDSRVYNPEQAERAWARMLALFERAL